MNATNSAIEEIMILEYGPGYGIKVHEILSKYKINLHD
jgi:hypothetical protein